MSKKINFMLAMLLVLLFAGAGFAEIKTQQPRYGNGTKDAPFKITSVAELYWLAEVVNGGKCSEYGGGNCSAELTTNLTVNSNLLGENNANVDAETGEYKGSAPANVWTPIGTSDNQYTGTFDGKGNTVSGLYFNSDSKGYVGLFGYNSGATVQNVGVIDSYLRGENNVGGVVGFKQNGTISNVYNTGSVSGSRDVGGVVGRNLGSTIRNVYNTGSVSGDNYVSGVVGYNSGSTISNAYNAGSVSGSGDVGYVGGVVGYNLGSTISNVYNTGSVSGDNYVGGVVGNNWGNTISNAYNTGSVSGANDVGGVVGRNESGGKISNVYNTGSVSGDNYVGGVVGWSNGELFKNAYNLGSVSKTTGSGGKYFGSVVGQNNGGFLTNTYYNKETSAFKAVGAEDGTSSDVEGSAGKTTVELAGATLMTLGFDSDVWTAGNATPEVKEGKLVCKLPGLTKLGGQVEFAVFTPNKDGVYEISSAQQLKWFAQLVNNGKPEANAILKADITFNDGSVYNGKGELKLNLESWTPIGTSLNNAYTGTFDGNGKTVSGLYFNDGTKAYVGFFGYISGATVQNVGVIDSYLRGNYNVGGVVGFNGGTISNAYNTGAVSGANYNVGGVVGYNGGTISNVYNTGSVNGTGGYVGGVAGFNYNGSISNVYNTGSVNGTGDYVGGVVGKKDNGNITNAYYNTDVACEKCNSTVGVGKTTFELASAKLTDDLGFGEDVWTAGNATPEVKEGKLVCKLPGLKNLGGSVEFVVLVPNGNDVYEISSAQQLKWFAQLVNSGKTDAKGILVDDIEFNDGSVYDGEGKLKSNLESWTPMGTTGKPFTGRFNALEDGGAAHTISGLYFNNAEKDSVGLFKKIGAAGSVANVGIVNSYIKGRKYVGSVAGLNEGSVSTSFNSSDVAGSSAVGGVVGRSAGEIVNVYNAGAVSGASEVGGVVGNNGGSVNDVYSIGAVSGTGSKVGGAIGGNTGTINGVYYDKDMPCTNCSDVAGVSGKYSVELADYGFVNSAFPNASSVWSAGSFVNNNGKLTFKMPYLTSFGAGTQPTFSGSFAISAKKKPVYKSKRFTADDFYTANFTIGSESFNKDAKGFVFSSLNDLTESGTVGGTYHGVEFSLLMDPLVVVDGDKATIHGESKQTLKIAEGDGFTIKGPITIKRNFTANGYSTVMFPFSMKASSVSGATFYELANVVMKDGKWVVAVSEVKDTETEVGMVKANTPYLVKTANASTLVLDEGEYAFVPTDGTLHSVESNGWNLVGTYGYKKWEEGDAGLGLTYGFAGAKGNPTAQIGKFGKIGAGAYIYPMRVYLEKNEASGVRPANGAKASDAIATLPESVDVVVVDGEAGEKTTVIGTLNSRTGEFKAAGKRYFDAKGRSVGKKPAAKGSYYNKRKAVAR